MRLTDLDWMNEEGSHFGNADWSREPKATYVETVQLLTDLSRERNDVRIEWQGGRGRRGDARIVFVDSAGSTDLRVRIKSAEQLETYRRILDSVYPIASHRALWYKNERRVAGWLAAQYDEIVFAIAQTLGAGKARKSRRRANAAIADVLGLLSSEGALLTQSGTCEDARTLCLKLANKELKAVYGGGRMEVPGISIELRNFDIADATEARDVLTEYGSSYLYSVTGSLNVSLRLWSPDYPRTPRTTPSKPGKMRFPQFRYDPVPLLLFASATSQDRDNIERFLKYYQVLEFYFPRAVQICEARENNSVNRIVLPSGKALRSERGQIEALLDIALSSVQLAGFMRGADTLSVAADASIFEEVKVLREEDGKPIIGCDYRPAVAERVYDIRCRIVHAKESASTGKPPPILPHTREARDLRADVRLVRFLAERVMRYWALPLR